MNSKKEVLAASILAIGLAIGLGTISFVLFSPTPSSSKLKSALDLFIQRGDQGVSVYGGNFAPFDNASIYAHVTQASVNLENVPMTFTMRRPDDTLIAKTTLTNGSGIAENDVYLVPSEGQVIGTWQVFANTTVDNEVLGRTLSFQCESEKARMDLFSKKNGVPSISFLPNDTVLLEAQLSYKNASTAGTPVIFEVITPDHIDLLKQNATMDRFGTASITFQITAPSDLALEVWQAYATSIIDGQTIRGSTSFGCFSLAPKIDIFTQKGGVGPNALGGYYILKETVNIYAEVRDEFNQTVANQTVAFAIKNPSGALFYAIPALTNASGIASISIGIPPDSAYVGTYQVYANARYQGQVVLSDTLAFIARQN